MKVYTDLEQSKKLTEILPLESADMGYLSEESLVPKVIYNGMVFFNSKEEKLTNIIPCWSLAALLDVLPEPNLLENNGWHLFCDNKDHFSSSNGYNNPVDACVAMIEKLHELKML